MDEEHPPETDEDKQYEAKVEGWLWFFIIGLWVVGIIGALWTFA